MATVVHDESAGATDHMFYIDGVVQPVGSQTMDNNARADVSSVYLGFANASGSGAEGHFTGLMSDFRLYGRAVTAEMPASIFDRLLILVPPLDRRLENRHEGQIGLGLLTLASALLIGGCVKAAISIMLGVLILRTEI